jgi:hypothetical protein
MFLVSTVVASVSEVADQRVDDQESGSYRDQEKQSVPQETSNHRAKEKESDEQPDA